MLKDYTTFWNFEWHFLQQSHITETCHTISVSSIKAVSNIQCCCSVSYTRYLHLKLSENLETTSEIVCGVLHAYAYKFPLDNHSVHFAWHSSCAYVSVLTILSM